MGSIASFPPLGSRVYFSLIQRSASPLARETSRDFPGRRDRLAEYCRPGETIIGRARLQLPKMVVKLKIGK